MVGQVRRSTTLRILLFDLILCVNDFKMKTMSLFSQTLLRLSGWDLIFKLNSKKEKINTRTLLLEVKKNWINTRTLLWVGSLRDTPPRGSRLWDLKLYCWWVVCGIHRPADWTLIESRLWNLDYPRRMISFRINVGTLLWVGSLRDTPPRGLKTNQSF